MHDCPSRRELLRLREVAHGADVARIDHIIQRLHGHRRLVVETLQMPTGLGEKHVVDALAGVPLRLLEGAVGAFAGRLVIDDTALDDPARGTLPAADDRELAPGVFANQDTDFGGTDFNGTEEGGA